MAERVVVVGHAAITCLGRDLDATWRGLVEGRSGLRRQAILPPERYLQDVAGLVEHFGPGTPSEDPAIAKLGARSVHLTLAAARAAWADTGLEGASYDPHRVAVVIGSALGGLDRLGHEYTLAAKRQFLMTSQYLVSDLIPNQGAGQVSQHLGLFGPNLTPASACATGGHAIALGGMFLRSGEADLALCGAGESAFTHLFLNGLATMRAVLPRNPEDRSASDPTQASRPFSIDRGGFVVSEGAGILVLATETTARRLGLEVKAEVAGWAMNSDGYHMARPLGPRIARCITDALRHAGIAPEDVDYYNAHGTSTQPSDKAETEAVKEAFGAHGRRLPVSSVKGSIGHSLGAASAIEAALCVRALREQAIPPTINYRADPELDLDFVPNEARQARLDTIVSGAFGFGGTNNVLVFKRCGRD